MKYTTSELAKILGVSGNTIRRFDEKGYLSSKRSEENEYRQFDASDVEKLMYVMRYRREEMSHSDVEALLEGDTEQILKTLEKMGYSPELDGDGDIMLHYQMKAIYVLTGDEDEPYVSILLPQFYEIEEGKDTLVLAVCNKMTRELKLAKVYIDQTFKSVTATCEFFYINEESLEQNLRNSLQTLGVVRTIFKNDLAELSEE